MIDREQAGRLGISMQAITDTLNDAFGQRQISTIYGQANQYRVILEAHAGYQRDPSSLSKLYCRPAPSPAQRHVVERDLEPADPADGIDHARAAVGLSRRWSAPPRRWRSRTRSNSRR